MKKYRLIIVGYLFVGFFKSEAQTYVPFPDSNAVWRQSANRFFMMNNICWDYQLYINGDTVINGITYKNIYTAGTWGPLCNDLSFNGPTAAIREDLNKHIYVYSYYDSLEHLLYDFNLSVGDTLPNPQPFSWNPYSPYGNRIITLIDSVQVGSSYRKAYWCSDTTTWLGSCINYVALIEGVGSTYGLFGDLSPNWSEKHDVLNCFKLNGQNVYPLGQPCTLLPVGINEAAQTKVAIEIYPNPIKDFFTVHCELANPITFTLYNSFGQIILEKIISEVNQIETENITNGIYFWKAISKDKVQLNGKVVVMK